MSKTVACFAVLLLGSGGLALAQPPGGGGPGRGRGGAMMAEACKGKKVNDTCEVSFGDMKRTGKCVEGDDKTLVCRPAPPPELLKACEKKKENDACSATMGDRKIEGKCLKGRDGSGPLSCRREGGGRGPGGGGQK